MGLSPVWFAKQLLINNKMTTEQQEICNVLIKHADTKKEVIDAMGVIPGLTRNALLIYINKQWRQREVDGRKISLMKRSYKEIADILLDLTEKLIAGKISSVEIPINKTKTRMAPSDLHKALCKNKWNLNDIRGKRLQLTDFDMVKLNLIDPKTNKQYQLLIWDISKVKYITVE